MADPHNHHDHVHVHGHDHPHAPISDHGREASLEYQVLERALQVNPDYLEARYNLALSLLELRRREDARREYRTLLQVTVEEAALADEIMSVLMGDDVESRRNFITANARDVRNLDF